MAVLSAGSVAGESVRTPRAVRFAPWARLAVLRAILTGPLPDDVRDEEYTVGVLFRGSLALNCLTGGAPGMTFSARCHDGGLPGRSVGQRLLWRLAGMTIDTACAVLRGECEHCAAAWANHMARTRGTRLPS